MSYLNFNKNLSGPFWGTLSLGVLSAAMSIYGEFYYWGPFWLTRNNVGERVLSLVIPATIFGEAVLFRRFRRKNVYMALTWAYLILLGLAHATAFGLEAILRMDMPITIGGTGSLKGLFVEALLIQELLFGGLFFTSQLLFLILLVRFRSRPAPIPPRDPRNLLDDLAP